MKTQLEEAEAIIERMTHGVSIHNNAEYDGSPAHRSVKYWAKYHKKDPLLEKFVEFMNSEEAMDIVGIAYDKFKEIFAEELNGITGLDEAIQETKSSVSQFRSGVQFNILTSLIRHFEEIKERLDKKESVK